MCRRHWSYGIGGILTASAVILFVGAPVFADQPGQSGQSAHLGLTGVVAKIESGVVFVRIPVGLRARTISPNKADRVGLHEAKVGDPVMLWVDEGNVLVDAHKAGSPVAGHRIIAGSLQYSDQYWSEIKLSTPEGIERFDVDALAGSKLSVFQEGARVSVELDEDNIVIDIHGIR
ncbi:MAG: hypothetical protein HY581_07350 [Nitrospirae bacterium]|nr:hypothetical protein [Nitrospirota bacterium]